MKIIAITIIIAKFVDADLSYVREICSSDDNWGI